MKNLLYQKIKIHTSMVKLFALIYIYISIYIFLYSWIRFYLSIPIMIIMTFVLYRLIKKWREETETISLNLISMVLIGIVLLIWLLLSGSGSFSMQTTDWDKHNAILSDLINKPWPVYYESANGDTALLTYYLGQYIVPALIGKIGHSVELGQFGLMLWNFIGLYIGYIFLCVIFHIKNIKRLLIVLGVMIFFGGLTSLAAYSIGILKNGEAVYTWARHWVDYSYPIQIASNYASLRWAFQHFIGPLLIIELFYSMRSELENYMAIGLPLIFYSSFAFIGMFPIFFISAFASLWKERKNFFNKIREILSVNNLLMLLSLGNLFFFYFINYILAEKPASMNFSIINYGNDFYIYFIFVFTHVLIWALLIFRKYKHDFLFYTIVSILILLPIFKMGEYNDLCMRGSTPLMLLLMIYVLGYLLDGKHKSIISCTIIMFCFFHNVIDFYYEYQEAFITFSIKGYPNNQDVSHGTLANWVNKQVASDDRRISLHFNYFTYDYKDTFLYKYILKR